MAFITIPGYPGKIYVPDEVPSKNKKHDCRDCFSCQMCSDDRCAICIKRACCEKRSAADLKETKKGSKEKK